MWPQRRDFPLRVAESQSRAWRTAPVSPSRLLGARGLLSDLGTWGERHDGCGGARRLWNESLGFLGCDVGFLIFKMGLTGVYLSSYHALPPHTHCLIGMSACVTS